MSGAPVAVATLMVECRVVEPAAVPAWAGLLIVVAVAFVIAWWIEI